MYHRRTVYVVQDVPLGLKYYYRRSGFDVMISFVFVYIILCLEFAAFYEFSVSVVFISSRVKLYKNN